MDEQNPRRKKRRRRRRRNRWPFVVIAVLVIVIAALAAMLLLNGSDDDPALGTLATPTPEATETPAVTATPGPTLQIDPNAGELITPTPAPVEPGVAIPGWGSMTIPAGVTEVQTSMQNPIENEGWYYLTFELRLKETDEVIFTTGLIPPGQYCNKVTLTRELEPGEYAAIVHVQPYRISDQSPTNNADLETVLIVK